MDALDGFGWKGVVLVAGALFGFFHLLQWVRDQYYGYTARPRFYRGQYDRQYSLPGMMPIKDSIKLDTRGIWDISSLAGTQTQTGYWGGQSRHLLNVDQSPAYSFSLLYRSAKYHPWTDSQKHEIRDDAFNIMYSARLHQS